MPQGSVINTTVLLGKLIEHNISTGAYKKYYLFNGKLLALREGLGSGSTYRYLVTDHLGSLNTTLNLDGTVYSDLRYTPFGKERWAINTSPTGARFTAQRLDTLLDLYNYNARYYDPAIARFISADTYVPGQKHMGLTTDFHEQIFLLRNREARSGIGPLNPQGLNRYSYVLNSPMIHVDLTGHESANIYLTPEETQNLIDALDTIKGILEDGGWELLAALFPIGTVGTGVEAAKEVLALFTGESASVAGIFTGGAGVTASLAFSLAVVFIGILVATLVVTGMAISWLQASQEIGELKDALQSAKALAGDNGLVQLYAEDNVIMGDYIGIWVQNGSGTHHHYDRQLGVLNDGGEVLIFMMKSLADQGLVTNPVTFSYWYGTYVYWGNDNWTEW